MDVYQIQRELDLPVQIQRSVPEVHASAILHHAACAAEGCADRATRRVTIPTDGDTGATV